MANKRVKPGSVGKRTKAKRAAAPKKRAAKKTKKAASKSDMKRPARKPAATGKTQAAKTAKPQRSTRVLKSTKGTKASTPRPSSPPRQAPAASPTSAQNSDHRQSSGLSRREIEEFRGMLLSKRAELVGDVSHLHAEAMRQNRQDAAGDLSSMPIHMADIGTDNYEQEFTLGLIESERAMLREIDDAIRRIDDGAYGLCVATGQPIGKKRLKANPWAKYCYEYKLAQEKGLMRRP